MLAKGCLQRKSSMGTTSEVGNIVTYLQGCKEFPKGNLGRELGEKEVGWVKGETWGNTESKQIMKGLVCQPVLDVIL